MTQYDERTEWYEFNQETIDALLSDGSEADATYTIEHHMACKDFDRLERGITELTADFVILQGDGNYTAAKAFLDEYGNIDETAKAVIASMSDIPVDIQPIYKTVID